LNELCPDTCLIANAGRGALDFPAGQIRRIASTGGSAPGPHGEVDETKRNVLKLLGIAGVLAAGGGGLAGGALQYAQPPQIGLTSFPKVALIDLDGTPLTATKVMAEYNLLTPDVITFNYPLRNEPNFLINLAPPAGMTGGASNVPGGVGPTGSIVAFSAICQHLGCPAPAIHYYPPGTCPQTPGGKAFYIHCTCHGSTYDVTNAAANLTGPAVLPLPQVTLEWDQSSDGLFATNVTGPTVNGHLSTLLGDYGVGTSSQLSTTSPVPACNFP
jgi:Rieske Fe-S protein